MKVVRTDADKLKSQLHTIKKESVIAMDEVFKQEKRNEEVEEFQQKMTLDVQLKARNIDDRSKELE